MPLDRSPQATTATGPSPGILAASRQAIVFRQHFPPPHRDPALSFFGGAPVAPRGFRVLYEEGGDKGWRTIEHPNDLGHAFGDQATFVWQWTQSADDCPRLLPKWTFQPIALKIPPDAYDPHERETSGAPFLWPGEKLVAEVLRRAQGEDVPSNWFSVRDSIDEKGGLRRPFANYPHDWRAVQICSGLLLHKTRDRLPSTHALRELSESGLAALVARIRDQAKAWFDRAAPHFPFAAVPQRESDEFWSWLADKPWLVRFVMRTRMVGRRSEELAGVAVGEP